MKTQPYNSEFGQHPRDDTDNNSLLFALPLPVSCELTYRKYLENFLKFF